MSIAWIATRFVLRDLRFRKFATLLTVLAIASGIAAFVALRIVSLGSQTAVDGIVRSMFAGEIVVYGEGCCDIPETVAEYLEEVPGVKKAIPAVWIIGYSKGSLAFIFGMRVEDLGDIVLKVVEGRMFNDQETQVCLIDESFAREYKVKVGDTILVRPQASSSERAFRVVGIINAGLKVQGLISRGAYILIPLREAQEIMGKTGYVTMILIKVEDGYEAEKVREQIARIYPGAQVYMREEILSGVNKLVGVIDGLLLAVSTIGILVAIFGTANTIMSSVREHAKEIAVLRAIGAKARDIAFIFILESVVLGLIGGISGSILGVLGANIVKKLVETAGIFEIPLVVTHEVIFVGIFSSLLASSISSLYPVVRAVQLKPVEVLKNE